MELNNIPDKYKRFIAVQSCVNLARTESHCVYSQVSVHM